MKSGNCCRPHFAHFIHPVRNWADCPASAFCELLREKSRDSNIPVGLPLFQQKCSQLQPSAVGEVTLQINSSQITDACANYTWRTGIGCGVCKAELEDLVPAQLRCRPDGILEAVALCVSELTNYYFSIWLLVRLWDTKKIAGNDVIFFNL